MYTEKKSDSNKIYWIEYGGFNCDNIHTIASMA